MGAPSCCAGEGSSSLATLGGSWATLEETLRPHPSLHHLAEHAQTSALRTITIGTLRKYLPPVVQYAEFVTKTHPGSPGPLLAEGEDLFPTREGLVRAFVLHKSYTAKSKYGAQGVVSSLNWFAKLMGVDQAPLKCFAVRSITAGDRRAFAAPRMVSDALTAEIFSDIMAVVIMAPAQGRARTIWIVLYYTGARLCTVLDMRRGDVWRRDDGTLVLTLATQKNDMCATRGGHEVLISPTRGSGVNGPRGFCPARGTWGYLERMGIADEPSKETLACKLFRRIQRSGQYCPVTKANVGQQLNVGISESTVRKDLKAIAARGTTAVPKDMWLTAKSARSGAVSTLITEGVGRDERQGHINWRSDSSADLYTEQADDVRLRPSEAISAAVHRAQGVFPPVVPPAHPTQSESGDSAMDEGKRFARALAAVCGQPFGAFG